MNRNLSVLCLIAFILQMFVPMSWVFAEDDVNTDIYTAPSVQESVYNMNIDWKFRKAEPGYEYPLNTALDSIIDGSGKQFYEIGYDDSGWEDVSIPHPVNAEDSFDGACYDAGEASLYRGFMFYRKIFDVPAENEGKKIFLEFESIRQSIYLYVNGEMVGYYEAGIAATGFDITEYVNIGSENLIAVATDNAASRGASFTTLETKPGSEPGAADGYGYQWNTKDFNEVQGGITGNVNLYTKNKIYQTLPLYNNLKTTGNYIYGSDYDIDNKSATINIKAEVRNETETDADLTLQVDVVAMDGTLAYSFENDGTVKSASDAGIRYMSMVPYDAYDENPDPTDISTVDVSYIEASFRAENMRFWSDKDPYMYTVYTILKDADGNIIDVQKKETGFRKVEYDINNGGLRINDKSVYLKGYAQRSTNEWAVIGVANDWLTDIDMQLIKESNANFIRWMHVAPKPSAIRSADKYGIISVCPAGDKEGDVDGRGWDQRVEAMRDAIIYFRNSPSIAFWEAGNNQISPEHMQEITELKQQLDPYGGRFAGCRTISSVEQIAAAEYAGTMLNRHAAGAKGSMAELNRYMPIIETEYARDEAPRRVWDDYSPPDYDYVNKWLGPNGSKTDGYDIWDQTSEDFAVNNAKAYEEFWNGRIGAGGDELYSGAAIMVWSDSNMHNRNTGTENCRTSGKVDAVRIKKEAFYSLQAVQSDTPKIHIVGHWNYPQLTDDTYWYEEKESNGTYYAGTGEMKQRDPYNKTVYVIGSPDIRKVELYVNGELKGTDYKPDNSFVYAFPGIDVTQSGSVSAKAYDEREICVSEDKIETVGEADHLRITPVTGPDGLIADGSDIMYFDVEIVDAQGRVCPLSYDRMDLSVNGEGVLLGGYTSGIDEKNTTGKDYTYAECGKNRIFVRSTRSAGSITLTVSVDGLGQFNSTVDSAAFENCVEDYRGLSLQPQRSYKADEQPPIIESKTEPFRMLAKAVKADFSEDGNTRIVEDIDTTDYYTVMVNGKEVNFSSKPYCPGAPTQIISEVAPVLDALKDEGADIEYEYIKSGERPPYLTDGSLPVIRITSGFDPDITTAEGEKIYQLDIVCGDTAVIINEGADKNLMDADTSITDTGELEAELKVMLGYLDGVSAERDEENKVYRITYESDIQGADMSVNGGYITISSNKSINDACVIFAAYNGDTLNRVSFDIISVNAGESVEIAIPEDIVLDSGRKKVMLWDSLTGMRSLCNSIELSDTSINILSNEFSVAETGYENTQLENNFNEYGQSDGPDGTGYLQSVSDNTIIFENMGSVLSSDSLISMDFRIDDENMNITFTNPRKKYGPIISYNGTELRTQTGGSSYQTLGQVNAGEWYSMEMEGKMGAPKSSACFRLYKYENGEKILVKETANFNLRQFGSDSNGLAEVCYASAGVSIDNLVIKSLYADEVRVTALYDEINAKESVLLSCTALRNGKEITTPEFAWTLYDEDGNIADDPSVSINDQMLVTTKDAKSQYITVRATAMTMGNPYGEVTIKINAVDTSNDTFDNISISSDKNYVRYGENTVISCKAQLEGEEVYPNENDIKWSIFNESDLREIKNNGISINNGVVSVEEHVLPQTVTVRASNESGSASAKLKLNIKPSDMIIDGETGNKDMFITGNACEEFTDDAELSEGSWDGSGYYKLSSAYDFTGFDADTSENVLYSADLRFDQEGAGWVVWSANKGKQGMQVKYSNGQLGIVRDGNNFNAYLEVDNLSWYNVQIMCAAGAGDNSYAHLIVYKYDENGNKINPKTGTINEPFVETWIPMRNLAASPANHIEIQAGTSVDNVYCAKTVPDAVEISVDKNTMFAGQSIQGSVIASRKGIPFGNIGSDVVKWVIYDKNNEHPLADEKITVDSSGKLTADPLADSQELYLRVMTIDGTLYDSVKISIQSSDTFTIHTIGFNSDYSEIAEVDITKNFSFSDEVEFIVCVYDKTETVMKGVSMKKISANNIVKGDEPVSVSLDAAMPSDFNKDEDIVYVYILTSISENEPLTEDDGTIKAEISGSDILINTTPEFDNTSPIILTVFKLDVDTTSVKESDIIYLNQFDADELTGSQKISTNSEEDGYIIKMAGKSNGMSVIRTCVLLK